MANRILEKNIFYNSISEQHLSFANQLTVHSWNDIINMLNTKPTQMLIILSICINGW